MKRLSGKEILQFTQSMSSLFEGGMNVHSALKVITNTERKKSVRELTEKLLNEIQSGRMLYQGLSETGQFSSFYIMLVKIGENSLGLGSVFKRLSEYLDKREESKNRVFQALLYPSLVLITVSIVLLIMAFYVFPRLSEVFEVLSTDGGGFESFNSLLNGIKGLAVFMVLFVLLAVVLSFFGFKNKRLRKIRDKLLYKIPVLKRNTINKNINIFCFSMKSLLNSGLSAEDALVLSEQAVQNVYFKAKLREAIVRVQRGRSLSESLSNIEVFPPYFSSWVKLNESTGDIKKTFSDMERYYSSEDERYTQILIKTIEPLFIVLTGLLVFTVVWRFVVPLYSMLGEIQI